MQVEAIKYYITFRDTPNIGDLVYNIQQKYSFYLFNKGNKSS